MKKFFSSVAVAMAMFAMVACSSAPSYDKLLKAVEAGDAETAAQISYELEKQGFKPTDEQQDEMEAALEKQDENFAFAYIAAMISLAEEEKQKAAEND